MTPDLVDQLVGRRSPQQDDMQRPVLYRPTDSVEAARLSVLLDEHPGLTILDRIDAQLCELAEVRHPDLRGDPERLRDRVGQILDGNDPRGYGVYAHYPWRNALVHLLDETEFVEVRTSRNRDKITAVEQDRLAGLRVGIIGLSAGQAVALTMATERSCGALRLADFDDLQLSNLNRLRASVTDLGLAKTVIAARAVTEIDPYLDVTCFPSGIGQDTLDAFLLGGGRLDLVVDECDSLDVKFLLRARARTLGIPVLMVTSEGGLVDVERFDLDPARPLLHGLAGDLDPARLAGLDTQEKIALVLQILGEQATSTRMRASLSQIGRTLVTWPQLASSVALGGAAAADTWRRIALGQPVPSGRYRLDPELAIPPVAPPRPRVAGPRMPAEPSAHNPSAHNCSSTFSHDQEKGGTAMRSLTAAATKRAHYLTGESTAWPPAPDGSAGPMRQHTVPHPRRPTPTTTLDLRTPARRTPLTAAEARTAREQRICAEVETIYDELTDGRTRSLRASDLVYAAAERHPDMLPSRAAIDTEREALQKDKQGLEIDQGVFLGHVLAHPRCGPHLMHAMAQPRPEALAALDELRRTGSVDLGVARVDRDGEIGLITTQNDAYLNSEDDTSVAALETAVDLVLLDDAVAVGVLRGGPAAHPKYAGRRIFGSGLNLTHLYHGKISLVEFMLERELGALSKIYRGHDLANQTAEPAEWLENRREKPFIGVVESFAIGGSCQTLLVLDRVVAEQGSYVNLPARKEGIIPGCANLRLPRFLGERATRQAIFFNRDYPADSPEGRMIVDDVIPASQIEAAIARSATELMSAGPTSLFANRRQLRVATEPLPMFRHYMANYAREQAHCLYAPALIGNLERNWDAKRRRP